MYKEMYLFTNGGKYHKLLIIWFRHLAEKILPKGTYYEIRRWPPLNNENFKSDIKESAFVGFLGSTKLPKRKITKSRIIYCGENRFGQKRGYILDSRYKVIGKGFVLKLAEIRKIKKIVGKKQFDEYENSKLIW